MAAPRYRRKNRDAVALIATALAYVLYFGILAREGAANLLLVTFLIPVSAIQHGVFVLGGTLLPRHVADMALTGAAACLDRRGLAALAGAAADGRGITKRRLLPRTPYPGIKNRFIFNLAMARRASPLPSSQ